MKLNLRSYFKSVLVVSSCLSSFHLYAASCDYSITNEWGTGFTASVSITNDTSQQIDGWTVELSYGDGSQITNMWNADVSGSGPYSASNKNYNATIPVNGSKSFGFNGRKGTSGQPASIPSLAGICSNSDTGDEQNQAPVANINASALSGNAPLTVDFSGSASTDADGDSLTYLWRVGSESASTSASFSHTFSAAGTYDVSLVVNDGELDSQTKSVSITVNDLPTEVARCQFSVVNEWHSGYTGSVTIFNDDNSDITQWQAVLSYSDATSVTGAWNATVSGSNPFTFDNANYNATIKSGENVSFGFNAQKGIAGEAVVAPSLSGICIGSAQVNQAPVASATVTPVSGDSPLLVTFDASASSDADGDTLSYLWMFNDDPSDTSTSAQFSRTFDEIGEQAVSLTVNDGELDSATATFSITVNEPVQNEGQAYTLDASRSSLYFVSTKKIHIIESHTFTVMSGSISEQGEAELILALDSIESGIDIRNERMREHLFETDTFAEAIVSVPVDMNSLESMPDGSVAIQTLSADLSLHGLTVGLSSDVRVTKLSDSEFMVQNTQPILINAEDFALTSGIDTLRNLAGLDSISYVVPVNFTFIFSAAE